MELPNRPRNEKDEDKFLKYAAKTPEPNYSEFGKLGVQYVDQKGREYIAEDDFEPETRVTRNLGRRRFWVRVPISLRGNAPFPDPDGEELQLYFFATQVLCRGTTDGVFVTGPRKKTGHVYLKNFRTLGQVSDPSTYEALVRKAPGKRKRKGLF